MINIQTIQNVADCVPLYLPHSLYLKPLARMNISVALPVIKTGKSISNLDIMEKLSATLKPDKFFVLRASKSTVEFIRFEAELADRSHLRTAISRLDGTTLKIAGFSESFRVRAGEMKEDFPTRYDWDAFFRDAHHMDEMKAGERPDTIHLTHLPIRWFCPRHSEHEDQVKPSENIFRRIFEKFGSVRCVDIPICDPYRSKMNADISGMKTFTFEQDVLFEAYVQFDEYVGFVRAMDEFRGMKLVRKFVDKTQAINITVSFDKTKHLSEGQLQRRERVCKRLQLKAKAEEEEKERLKKVEKEKLLIERKKEEQLKLDELAKQLEREEKRKEKHLKKIQERGQVEISQKIRIEERKLMIAQRKLESIRILEQLFDRMKLKNLHKQKSRNSRKHDLPSPALQGNENDLRDRLVEKYKTATEKLLNEQKQKVEDIKSKTVLMGLFRKKPKASDSSDNDADNNAKKLKRSNSDANADASATSGAKSVAAPADGLQLNPFRAVAALAADAGNPSAYSTETAREWMKSLSMFQYVPQMFPGMPHAAAAAAAGLYRPPAFPVSVNYRGFAPRMRMRGRGRGRGRGGYDGQYSSSSYYQNYKNYNYDEEDESSGGGHYRKSSYVSRSRNRSRSRSRHYSKRSRSRSHSRRRTRSHSSRRSRTRRRSHSHSTRSRSHSSKRSYTKSHTRSKSKSKSKGHRKNSKTRDGSAKSHKSRSRSKTTQRTNKKLVSTRRSRSTSWSSKSRSKSRSKRSWSRSRRGRDRSYGVRGSGGGGGGSGDGRVVLETDELVRSAEAIKQHFEKDMRERLREEAREIKENFRHSKFNSSAGAGGIVSSSGGGEIDMAMELSEADRAAVNTAEVSADNSPTHDVERSSSRRAEDSADNSPTQDNKRSSSRRNSYEKNERKVDA